MNKVILHGWFSSDREVKEWITKNNKSIDSYEYLLKNVLTVMNDVCGEDPNLPDPERIVSVDHGDYQGDLIFIIGGKGYQPDVTSYWYTSVYYGSCSGCDTMLALADTVDEQERIKGFMTLAMHMIQHMERLVFRPGEQDAVGVEDY